MLFLTRLLMKSVELASPTIVLITDRTDLDDQLAEQFVMAKGYIGDDGVVSVESRAELRERLQGKRSGGVFLTTIHKFTEGTELLTERSNVVCISDEAHRSQTNPRPEDRRHRAGGEAHVRLRQVPARLAAERHLRRLHRHPRSTRRSTSSARWSTPTP